MAIAEFIAELKVFEKQLGTTSSSAMVMIAGQFSDALKLLEDLTNWFLSHAPTRPWLAGTVGVNFLLLMGHVTAGWLLARSAVAAQALLDQDSTDCFYTNKIKTAVYFATQILPRCHALYRMVKLADDSVMSIDVHEFG